MSCGPDEALRRAAGPRLSCCGDVNAEVCFLSTYEKPELSERNRGIPSRASMASSSNPNYNNLQLLMAIDVLVL